MLVRAVVVTVAVLLLVRHAACVHVPVPYMQNPTVNNDSDNDAIWKVRLHQLIDETVSHPRCVDVMSNVFRSTESIRDLFENAKTTAASSSATTPSASISNHLEFDRVQALIDIAQNSSLVDRALDMASRGYVPVIENFLRITKCNETLTLEHSQTHSGTDQILNFLETSVGVGTTTGGASKGRQRAQAFFFVFGLILHLLGCEDVPTATQWKLLEGSAIPPLPPDIFQVVFDTMCNIFYWGRWFRAIDDIWCWNPKTAPEGCSISRNLVELGRVQQQVAPVFAGIPNPAGQLSVLKAQKMQELKDKAKSVAASKGLVKP